MMTEARRAVGRRNMADKKILLEARDLVKEFALEGGKKGKNVVHAVSLFSALQGKFHYKIPGGRKKGKECGPRSFRREPEDL